MLRSRATSQLPATCFPPRKRETLRVQWSLISRAQAQRPAVRSAGDGAWALEAREQLVRGWTAMTPAVDATASAEVDPRQEAGCAVGTSSTPMASSSSSSGPADDGRHVMEQVGQRLQRDAPPCGKGGPPAAEGPRRLPRPRWPHRRGWEAMRRGCGSPTHPPPRRHPKLRGARRRARSGRAGPQEAGRHVVVWALRNLRAATLALGALG